MGLEASRHCDSETVEGRGGVATATGEQDPSHSTGIVAGLRTLHTKKEHHGAGQAGVLGYVALGTGRGVDVEYGYRTRPWV